jgi:hypothetical protein
MPWYVYVAYFVGGAFLANSVPHFVHGISGQWFPSPFASPPGRGQSSPIVNVLWGAFNVAMGYLLISRVGSFTVLSARQVLVVGLGGLLMAVLLARAFARATAK